MAPTCIFAGPTLHRQAIPSGIERFGPAVMGAIFRAVEAGYRRIAIVDGAFGNVPSIWHKEILFAIAAGVEVSGASSMGALRAAELFEFGMIGVGRIYRLYRGGAWADDDEVAVIHAPAALAYCPLSHAMVNIRYTMRRLVRVGAIESAVAKSVVVEMKALHFSQRTDEELRANAQKIAGSADADRLMQLFAEEYIDAKKLDAQALVRFLEHEPAVRAPHTWLFPATRHWRQQFIQDIDDVPQLS